MAPALELASRFPNVTVVPAVESLEGISAPVLVGSPDSHLPPLTRDDVIYAAGAPVMIDRVAAAASSVGASFYSDPFEPSATDETATLTKIGSWFRAAVSGHM